MHEAALALQGLHPATIQMTDDCIGQHTVQIDFFLRPAMQTCRGHHNMIVQYALHMKAGYHMTDKFVSDTCPPAHAIAAPSPTSHAHTSHATTTPLPSPPSSQPASAQRFCHSMSAALLNISLLTSHPCR